MSKIKCALNANDVSMSVARYMLKNPELGGKDQMISDVANLLWNNQKGNITALLASDESEGNNEVTNFVSQVVSIMTGTAEPKTSYYGMNSLGCS